MPNTPEMAPGSSTESWDGLSNTTSNSNSNSPPAIAICGMAMRLPGNIASEEQLWDFLLNKGNARTPVPESRYHAAAFHGHATHGYFLSDDMQAFDASLFKLTKAELDVLDPQVRLLLEVTRECFESAGETGWRGTAVGVYIGCWSDSDFKELQSKDPEYGGANAFSVTGLMDFQFANKISHEYDLHGPSFTLKSACSSGVAALHEAFRAIQAGDVRAALVGGTNLLLSPTQTSLMYKGGVLSPRDQCRSFDAGGDGYCRAEGVNMLYLKRVDDALRDGNPIRAIVRGSWSNADGEGEGLFAPSARSHEALIRSCYQSAGISEAELGRTAHVECHGTGTPVGDPIETTAIANVFGPHGGVTIGSVKPNLGHSEGASGITSIIKSVLALEHGLVPPNIMFDTPNPNIPWQRGGLRVPVEATPLPADRDERISVNAFGLGGSNAHVILESARSFLSSSQACQSQNQEAVQAVVVAQPQLLLYSANRLESAKAGSKRLADYVARHVDKLADVAFTLAHHRERLPWATFAVVDNDARVEFAPPVKVLPQNQRRDVAFVFTGQGAQWATMGSALLMGDSSDSDYFPSAVADIAAMDEALSSLSQHGLAPSWTIREELAKADDTSNVAQAEYSQPLCTAVQIMLVNILRAWGVQPCAVVGHSSGEIAAAYAAGALTTRDAIICAYLRGWATSQSNNNNKSSGAMAAIGLGRDAVQAHLSTVPAAVQVACENSPSSVTISGDADAVQQVLQALPSDVFARKLRVDKAYHSHHMKEPAALLEHKLQDLSVESSSNNDAICCSTPFYSTVTNKVITAASELNAPSYWRSNMESPVLFNTAMQTLLQQQHHDVLLLEIGPHSALAGPIRQILQSAAPPPPPTPTAAATYIPTLVRGADDRSSLLTAAGRLFLHDAVGLRVTALSPTSSTNDGRLRRRVVVPTIPPYPWHRDAKYWHESRLSSDWRLRRFPRHELLGSRVHHCSDLEPAWRNILKLVDIPWCRDHVIARDIVLPATAYLVMMCEAVRQVTACEDYSFRNVTITAPLILDDDSATEIVLVLRPMRITNSLNSPSWFDVTISSCSTTTKVWTKHCTAQIRGGPDEAAPPPSSNVPEIVDLPRVVDMAAVYEALKSNGLRFGPAFRRLGGTTAYPGRATMVRHVSNKDVLLPGDSQQQQQQQQPNHYHPVTIDLCLQLSQIVARDGLARNATNMTVPSFVRELYIKRPTPDGQIAVQVQGHETNTGGVVLSAVGVAGNGDVVLRLAGCKMNSLADNGDDDAGLLADPHAGARLLWKPDLRFRSSLRGLVSSIYCKTRPPHAPLQRFTLLACIEAQQRLRRLLGEHDRAPRIKDDHLAKFRAWIDDHVSRAQQTRNYAFFVDNVADLVVASDARRAQLLQDDTQTLLRTSANTAVSAAVTAVHRLLDAMEDIFRGDVNPLDLLRQGDLWTNLYKLDDKWVYTPYLRLLSHRRPNLRVLEIGAGTGGTTELVLPGLHDESGQRMFHSYTFTDISAGFLGSAKERFSSVQGMVYSTLDITMDPEQQGFTLASFDLIVVANVIHATPSLSVTLQNVRKLLKSDGKLLLQEMCADNKILNFIMGTLPGWWLGADDDRLQEPYVHPERWDRELKAAGFTGNDAVIFDEEQPFQIDMTILSSAKPDETPPPPAAVSLLSQSPDGRLARMVAASLQKKGLSVDIVQLSQEPQRPVISLLDLEEGPVLDNISPQSFQELLTFLLKSTTATSGRRGAGLLWLTKPCQIQCQDPAYSQIIGLTRVLRSEHQAKIATLELDEAVSDGAMDALYSVFLAFHQEIVCGKPPADDDVGPDSEYAWSRGAVLVARLHWMSVTQELAEQKAGHGTDSIRKLEILKPGSLQSLAWLEQPNKKPGLGQVLVEVRAVGMNFKDILISMGIVGGNGDDANDLGLECSGIVRELGPGVTGLQIGDRVAGTATGSYATLLSANAGALVRIPDQLSFEAAATMPSVFGTVIYSLLDLARLEKGQTVLIHSACGGIGLAAIQICRHVGAQVFVTVGNDEKVTHLIQEYGIPRDHIFSSRNAGFLPAILKATEGRGVDVVLNSLSGDLLHASWNCVAEFGCMLELGKRDFIGQGQLNMNMFEENRSFVGVNMVPLTKQRPKTIRRVLEKMMELYRTGAIQPIQPMQVFPGEEIEGAFRAMQQGKHIGKLVVQMPRDKSALKTTAVRQKLLLRPDASYLLVGGLGGLGRSLSTWMVERGARNLVFLSRSAGNNPKDEAFLRELEAMGCTAQLVPGSVTDLTDVKRAVELARLPIAGVVQMSMVLRDGMVENMCHEDWEAVVKPKVQGTWNLHNALANHSLDFFLLFGSMAGLLGQRAQANYASANTFLDAFVQFRQGLGLPASVIDLGVVGEVGYVSGNSKVLSQLRGTAHYILRERDVLDGVELALAKSAPQLSRWLADDASVDGGYVSEGQLCLGLRTTQRLSSVQNNVTWKHDPRMSMYRNLEQASLSTAAAATAGGAADDGGLKEFLLAVESEPQLLQDESQTLALAGHIRTTLSGFMIRPAEEMDIHGSLSDLGVDSLVAIELRNWFRRAMALDVSVLEVTQAESIGRLAQVAVERMKLDRGIGAT